MNEYGGDLEFGFVLKHVGTELDKWIQRRRCNRKIIAESADITLERLDSILDGEANDVTLKEISDIAYQLGLELIASITKQ